MEFLEQILNGLIGGTVTGVTAWAVIRVEMKYHRRDIDHAHKRIDRLQEKIT